MIRTRYSLHSESAEEKRKMEMFNSRISLVALPRPNMVLKWYQHFPLAFFVCVSFESEKSSHFFSPPINPILIDVTFAFIEFFLPCRRRRKLQDYMNIFLGNATCSRLVWKRQRFCHALEFFLNFSLPKKWIFRQNSLAVELKISAKCKTFSRDICFAKRVRIVLLTCLSLRGGFVEIQFLHD